MKRTFVKNIKNLARVSAVSLAALAILGGLNVAPQTAELVGATARAQLGSVDINVPQLPAGSGDINVPNVKLPNGQRLSDVVPGSSSGTSSPQRGPNRAKPAPRIGNGMSKWVHTKSSGRNRRYLVDMPVFYNASKPAPILFGFDGWQDSPENFRRYSRMHETGARREAIRIYPESINHGWEGAPYATGHSNGGGMTAVVACQLPHVFAGVASVGGAYYDPVNQGCRNQPIPFLISHGKGDTMMRYNGGSRHGQHYLAVPELVNSYAKRNACAPTPKVTRMPGGKRHTYRCAGAELQLLTNAQDHTWNRTPDASQEVWNFLKRQRL